MLVKGIYSGLNILFTLSAYDNQKNNLNISLRPLKSSLYSSVDSLSSLSLLDTSAEVTAAVASSLYVLFLDFSVVTVKSSIIIGSILEGSAATQSAILVATNCG